MKFTDEWWEDMAELLTDIPEANKRLEKPIPEEDLNQLLLELLYKYELDAGGFKYGNE